MKTFKQLDLIPPIRQALKEENYEIPTPIQAQTIPAALDGRDVLGCAQTGTGKTAAFALPILNELGSEILPAKPNRPLVLVLAPTRELAIQINDSFSTYGKHLKLKTVLVYGGVKQGNQVRALARGAQILIATPGRLLDLMNQGFIKLNELEFFVLDEADRMLDMGFLPDLNRIIKKLPRDRQSLFFSATMPPHITELSRKLLTDPISVNVTPKQTSVERIQQRLMLVEKSGKQRLLQKTLTEAGVDRAIVFTRTKRGANLVAERLGRDGIRAAAIHGNKSQGARQRALDAFRNGYVKVLVATDVAARGIDIDGVSHVINFDLPNEPESYVHRIGRTGRAGAEGIAISFCSRAERKELVAIEKLIGQTIPLPDGQPRELDSSDPNERKRRSPYGRGNRNSNRGGSGSRKPGNRKQGSRGGKSTRRTSTSASAGGERSNESNGRRNTQAKRKPKSGRPGNSSTNSSATTSSSRRRAGSNSPAASSKASAGSTSASNGSGKKRRPRKGKNARLRSKQSD